LTYISAADTIRVSSTTFT